MKKRLLLFILICLIANVETFAQSTQSYFDVREKIKFGVKIGGQVTAVNKIHTESKKRFPGLTIGATMKIPLLYHRLYFAPELMYSQEGEKNGSIGENFYQDYIAHSILLKGYFGTNNRLFVELGPKLNYMINHKNKEKDLGDCNKYDFGLCFGGGLSLGANNNFEIGARASLGLIDIYPTIKNKNYNIGGAVIFTYFF